MFESPDLTDLAFLRIKGFQVVPTVRRGALQFFEADLPVDQAEKLLCSAEREFLSRFQTEWRRLRREIDRLAAQSGNGGSRR